MKVMVTGGAGFIGSHIVDELLRENYQVVIVDNLVTGREGRIPAEASFYKADIRTSLENIFTIEKPDIIIHQAAQVSVSNSVSDPLYDAEQNILGTVNLLNCAVKFNIKKFIFASSAAIYGNPHFLPITENHPSQPLSFYGLSKLTAESYIQMFADYHDLPYSIMRYSNVYGTRQDAYGEAGVIAIFKERILAGESPSVYGDGNQTRDFIYVKDVARANVAAITNKNSGIYNISSHERISVLGLIKEFEKITSADVNVTFFEERNGDIRDSVLSNAKASADLKWLPETVIQTGLKMTLEEDSPVSIV